MRRFLIILSLIIFTTNSFAVSCPAGYYDTGASITAPSSNPKKSGYYSHDGTNKDNYTSPALSAGEWSATWNSIGVAKGTASCNGTYGTVNSTSGSSDWFSTSTTGQYCWCKMTEWTPSGGTTQSLAGKWVLNTTDFSSASYCAYACVIYCSAGFSDSSAYRSAAFGAVEACVACPDGGTSTAGATTITQCYLPANTNYSDSKGTYHFSSNCYYSN